MKEWTKVEIAEKIRSDQAWLERAVLAIYDLQTVDEKKDEKSKLLNLQGFNSPDAHLMSYCAKWIRAGHHLTGGFLAKARKVMPKYSGQLARIANGQL